MLVHLLPPQLGPPLAEPVVLVQARLVLALVPGLPG
jgi:hypothetical protein